MCDECCFAAAAAAFSLDLYWINSMGHISLGMDVVATDCKTSRWDAWTGLGILPLVSKSMLDAIGSIPRAQANPLERNS